MSAAVAALPPDHLPGANKPPPDRPYEAVAAHIDDLYAEAKNWLDGVPIATAAQADEVARLLDLMRQAHKAADDARVLENKPFDDGKAEVQARYAPLISDTKTAPKGKTVIAVAALKDAQTAWLLKVDAERQAEALRLRLAAEAKAEEAAAAVRAASGSTDLEAREEAEALVMVAKAADKAADRVEGSKAQAHGEFRAVGLRDNWVCNVVDDVAAMRWAWDAYRAELTTFALGLARAEVRAGKRTISGFNIVNERRV